MELKLGGSPLNIDRNFLGSERFALGFFCNFSNYETTFSISITLNHSTLTHLQPCSIHFWEESLLRQSLPNRLR